MYCSNGKRLFRRVRGAVNLLIESSCRTKTGRFDTDHRTGAAAAAVEPDTSRKPRSNRDRGGGNEWLKNECYQSERKTYFTPNGRGGGGAE